MTEALLVGVPLLLLAGIVGIAGFVIRARYAEHSSLPWRMMRLQYGIDEMSRVIGEKLTPAFLQVGVAMRGWVEAWESATPSGQP